MAYSIAFAGLAKIHEVGKYFGGHNVDDRRIISLGVRHMFCETVQKLEHRDRW